MKQFGLSLLILIQYMMKALTMNHVESEFEPQITQLQLVCFLLLWIYCYSYNEKNSKFYHKLWFLVGNIRHHKEAEEIEKFTHYVVTSLKKGLALYPSANVVVFGDCFFSNYSSASEIIKLQMIKEDLKLTDFTIDEFKVDDINELAELGQHYNFLIRSSKFEGTYSFH